MDKLNVEKEIKEAQAKLEKEKLDDATVKIIELNTQNKKDLHKSKHRIMSK